MDKAVSASKKAASRPVRGAWIEIQVNTGSIVARNMSRPVRGAWIEISW